MNNSSEARTVKDPSVAEREDSFFYVVTVTLMAALGGVLFGYDIAVISGAIGFLQDHFQLGSTMKGWATSSALIGCMGGVVIAGMLSDWIGRKKTMILSALLFLTSAIGTALPETLTQFITFRMIGGMGVGIASMISPTYIAEMAPSRYRGGLVALYQFAIILGMQVAYCVNYFITSMGGGTHWNTTIGWRWMFGSESIPALFLLLALFFVPETPRWLITKGRYDEAESILGRIFTPEGVSEKLDEIRTAVAREDSSIRQLFEPGLRTALVIGVALAILQQATGINVILYYAPEIFQEIGSDVNSAMLQTVVVGSVNLGFTVVAMWLVDRVGRRPLLMTGVSGMGLSLTLFGTLMFFGGVEAWGLVFVLTYIACFATSMGPVVWVVISEIFPNRVRGRAVAIASFFLWGTNYVVAQTFPMLNQNDWLVATFNKAFPFWLYALFCLLTLIFVAFVLPETKKKSLEEIEELWGIDLSEYAGAGNA